jgi:hypothetical protein
LTSAG